MMSQAFLRSVLLAGIGLLGFFHSSLSAQTAPAPDNVLGLSPAAVKTNGMLVIVGGGRLPDEADEAFYEHGGGKKARMVLIPSAYPFSSRERMESYYKPWSDMDCESFDFIDTESRDEANSEDFVKPLRNATAVWIGGGVQGRLADIYGGTKVEEAIRGVLERGGVVGGTSAGAAILSRTMIRSGRTEVIVGQGFPLLKNAVIDQHFTQRNRQPRLTKVVTDHSPMIGFGIDESTALLVHGNEVRVVGEGEVTVCASDQNKQIAWTRKLEPGDIGRFEPAPTKAASATFVNMVVAGKK